MVIVKEVGYDNTAEIFTAVGKTVSLQGLAGNRLM